MMIFILFPFLNLELGLLPVHRVVQSTLKTEMSNL
mgnify:CR=1 FL=1